MALQIALLLAMALLAVIMSIEKKLAKKQLHFSAGHL